MARSRERFQPHDEGKSRGHRSPSSREDWRLDPDNEPVNLKSVPEIMGLTDRELARLKPNERAEARQTLLKELENPKAASRRAQLEERLAMIPAEPVETKPEPKPMTPKVEASLPPTTPIENAPGPDKTELAATDLPIPPETRGLSEERAHWQRFNDDFETGLRKIVGDEKDDADVKRPITPDQPNAKLPAAADTPTLTKPEPNPIKPAAGPSSGRDISEDELHQILGPDYDTVWPPIPAERPDDEPQPVPVANPEHETAPTSPESGFSEEEAMLLQHYVQGVAEVSQEERAASARTLDTQIHQLVGDVDVAADPIEKARLQHMLDFARKRRDIITGAMDAHQRRVESEVAAPTEPTTPEPASLPVEAPTPSAPESAEPTAGSAASAEPTEGASRLNNAPDVLNLTPEELAQLGPNELSAAYNTLRNYGQQVPNATVRGRVHAQLGRIEPLLPPRAMTEAGASQSAEPEGEKVVTGEIGTIEGFQPRPHTIGQPESIDDIRRRAVDVDAEPVDREGAANLEQARANAARALLKRGQIFGRTGDKEVNAALLEYQTAIATEQQTKIDGIKQEFAGRDMTDAATAAELQGRLVEFALTERFAEETALRDAMKSSGERGAGLRFKNFWKKNSGRRALIGAGLFGAGLATGGMALPGLLVARAGMSSIGTTMMMEGGVQALMDKYGDTRKLTAEQIASLTEPQLRTLLAAHVTRFGERGDGEFGIHTDKFLKKTWTDDTGKKLLDRYQAIEKDRLARQLAEQGTGNPEAMIAGVLGNSLDEQKKLHESYAEARTFNRKTAMFKWTLAIAGGALAGTVVALSGLERLHHIKDAKGAAQSAAEHANQPVQTPDVSAARELPREPFNPRIEQLLDSRLNQSIPGHNSLLDTMTAGPDSSHAASAAEVGTAATIDAGTQAAEHAASFKETAQQGDSVWKLITNQLHHRLGENFDKLDPARKTFIIDSIKDQVAAHPNDYGLTDIDHIGMGKVVDFTAAFEGPHAVNLPEVVTHAKELSQQAVDSITHNNEMIAHWVTSHPGEPLNDTIIHTLIHGASTATPEAAHQTAELLGVSHEQIGQVLADHMTRNAIQQSILGFAKTNPELYTRFHEMNPDCYPAVVGVTTETATATAGAAKEALEFSSSHLHALEKSFSVLDSLPQTGASREALHAIGELKVSQVLQGADVITDPLQKAGLDAQTARATGQVIRKVVLETHERFGADARMKNVFESIHKNIA